MHIVIQFQLDSSQNSAHSVFATMHADLNDVVHEISGADAVFPYLEMEGSTQHVSGFHQSDISGT